MFVSDIKSDFYDIIYGHRVLLLVGFDVDALCSCRILQYIFQCDHVIYTLVPVSGKEALVEAFREHGNQVKFIILINCGANIDIVELLQPKDDVIFFIADSHRPVDVYNVYNDRQVRLLFKLSEEESIPSYEELFRDEESEDDSMESENRFAATESQIMQRREKRLWEEKRHKIMFEYTQFSYYGISTSLIMFELAWKLSKDTSELLWWTIIGLTDQFFHKKIEQDKYVLSAAALQNHVLRHNHRGESDNSISVSCLRVNFEKELRLSLYRHWSLFESLKHTMFTACKFKLWTLKGQKKIYEFLAEIGLPLVQCKQRFSAMDIQLRNNVSTWLEGMAEKYGLDQMVYGSFTAQYGFRNKYCATDIVHAATALLEGFENEKSLTDKFLDAFDCLCRENNDILEKGIEQAKWQLTAVFKQVQSFLDMNYIICAGPFLYAVIQEGTPDSKYFSYPGCLTVLAYFLLQGHVSAARSKKTRTLPLIVMAPYLPKDGMSLVVGIPPVSEESPKNFFGKAFEQAALRTKCTVCHDYFEPSVICLKNEDRSKFFDALVSLLS